ncbi:unnamed protein product [Heligmosomoides polygyrus]|uniref:Protein aurora borealis n=1 Tax=Heligmosomoides polygyrus TaxID=6339 RepID=A0A183FFM2_HELPZ|nr:unnamed protein product [Heligmosomoides polygyrus]
MDEDQVPSAGIQKTYYRSHPTCVWDSKDVQKTSSNVRWDSDDVLKTSFNVRRYSEDVPQTSNLLSDSKYGEPIGEEPVKKESAKRDHLRGNKRSPVFSLNVVQCASGF